MLHGGTRLLLHDLSQTRVVGRRGAIRDGEVIACGITREENRDVPDRRVGIRWVGWKLELSVGSHI